MNRPLSRRLVSWRIGRALLPGDATPVLGDLAEEYRRDVGARGRLRAEARYLSAGLSIARAYRRDRHAGGLSRFGDALWSGGRDAWRSAAKQPGLTAAMLVPLAFALAVNTALFSIYDGLLFRPLPFDTDRLIAMSVQSDITRTDVPKYFRLKDEIPASPLLAGAVHAFPDSPFADAPDAAAELGLVASGVSPGFFTLLGVRPVYGRDLDPTDEATDAMLPAVMGHELWRRAFGGDPAIVGSIVRVAGRPVRVVGIAAPGVDYPRGSNLWILATSDILNQVRNVGRLAPGASIAQLETAYPDFRFEPLRASIQPRGTEMLAVLLAATGVFLLTAWVQIGGLMLSRAAHRAREVGVRLALGATRRDLAFGVAVESALLTAIALAAAWFAVPVVIDLIASQLPPAMLVGQHIDADRRTFTFGAIVSIAGVMVLTMTPLELMRRGNPSGLLRGSGAGVRVRAERARSALLVVQMAFSTLLLCLAGLTLHSYVRVARVDVGFQPDGLWRFTPPAAPDAPTREQRLANSARRNEQVQTMLQAVLAHPEVASAAVATTRPLSPNITGYLRWPGSTDTTGLPTGFTRVTPAYFRTLGLRTIEGSIPESSGVPVAIVNATLARKLASSGLVVGLQIQVVGFNGPIVAVVSDMLDRTPGVPTGPHVFTMEARGGANVLLARVPGDANRARAILTPLLERGWGPFAPARLSPVRDDVDAITAPWRARSILLGLVATLCLPLAIVGVVGSLFYTVRTRTREIAIRLALGAGAPRVRHAIVRRALAHVGAGLLVGLAAGVAAGRLIASQLFEVRAADGATIAGVTLSLLAVTWLAAWLPARRASAIAPALALKDQ